MPLLELPLRHSLLAQSYRGATLCQSFLAARKGYSVTSRAVTTLSSGRPRSSRLGLGRIHALGFNVWSGIGEEKDKPCQLVMCKLSGGKAVAWSSIDEL